MSSSPTVSEAYSATWTSGSASVPTRFTVTIERSPPTPVPVLHHYIFELYALDVKLDPALDSREGLMKAMAGHVLAKGAYFATYTNPTASR